MDDRFFKYAVLVSLILHSVLFIRLYLTRHDLEEAKDLQVAYQVAHPKEKLSTRFYAEQIKQLAPPPMDLAGALVRMDGDATPRQSAGPEQMVHRGMELPPAFKIVERTPEKVKGLKVTRDVSVPILKSEKIDTPAYATYYQIVRERIRDRAYNNFTQRGSGDVYITFVIKSDGSLSQVQIMQDKSQADAALCRSGLDSVKEAAPFPPFPMDLNYPELSFNIQITFQMKEE